MLEIEIDKDECSGCAYCILACPQKVLDLDYSNAKAYVADLKECIVCRNCEEQCPKGAIKVQLNNTLSNQEGAPKDLD
jgi:2-oxoglutarate ferredoxin oxidoreductase subunit delta